MRPFDEIWLDGMPIEISPAATPHLQGLEITGSSLEIIGVYED